MIHTRISAVGDTTIPTVQIPNISGLYGFLQKMLTRLKEEKLHLSKKPLSHPSEYFAQNDKTYFIFFSNYIWNSF